MRGVIYRYGRILSILTLLTTLFLLLILLTGYPSKIIIGQERELNNELVEFFLFSSALEAFL